MSKNIKGENSRWKRKINQVLIYIPAKNITELNEVIYAGAKSVCEKIGVPLNSTDNLDG